MRRRQFLGLLGGLGVAAALSRRPSAPAAAAPTDRLSWWQPAPPFNLFAGQLVAVEWRYLAGRITSGGQDFGFVLSITDRQKVPGYQSASQELLVSRQDLAGAQAYATRSYAGARSYDASTSPYSYGFTIAGASSSAISWRYDDGAGTYALSVATPELTLSGLTLRPAGAALLPEAGDGDLKIATLAGAAVNSDYHCDWLSIEQGGQTVGYARLDMQTIRPGGIPSSSSAGFAHHWFALAAEAAGKPVWLSAYKLVSESTTAVITLARSSGAGWAVDPYVDAATIAHPLTVDILDWQPVPGSSPTLYTGKRWRVRAGQSQPGDLLDLEVSAPAGQFIAGARVSQIGLSQKMLEAVGVSASGTIDGAAIGGVRFTVAETTYTASEPTATPTPTPTATATATATATPTATADPTPSVKKQRVYLPAIKR
jgi:hypothetical protein